eukprot:Gb_28394 [translate_table: standard]
MLRWPRSVYKCDILSNKSHPHRNKCCRIECGGIIYHIFASSNDGLVHAIPNNHQICLLFAHFNIFLVSSFFHLDYVSLVTFLRSRIYCFCNRLVISTSILSHNHV